MHSYEAMYLHTAVSGLLPIRALHGNHEFHRDQAEDPALAILGNKLAEDL